MSVGPEKGEGEETEARASATVEARDDASERGGWVPLPPTPGAGRNERRYRAPWASQVTSKSSDFASAPVGGPAPATPPSATPQAPSAPAPEPSSDARPTPAGDGGTDFGDFGPAPAATADAATGTTGDAAPAPRRQGTQSLEFSGTGGEYFRVWIVNVCLTVLTLGIYSAWSKVRTRRYFYRHTTLDGSPFDYLAEPMQILKGRAVLGGLVGLYMVASFISPVLEGLSWVVILFMVPWVVVRALRFRAVTSAWRNIRFGFDASYGEAFKVFIGLPLATALTLGLLYPYAQWRKQQFITDHSRFGLDGFALGVRARDFYRLHLKVSLMAFGAALLVGAAAYALMPMIMAQMMGASSVVTMGARQSLPPLPLSTLAMGFGAQLLVVLGMLFLWCYMRAHTVNLVWNGTAVGPHRFRSSLTARGLAGLYVTNALATALSLGLLVPWARVRMMRYRIESLAVIPGGDLSAFGAAAPQSAGALGDEMSDAMDLDLGL
jgi:uncharacterized membrane protein YjgN (DUF898 family)